MEYLSTICSALHEVNKNDIVRTIGASAASAASMGLRHPFNDLLSSNIEHILKPSQRTEKISHEQEYLDEISKLADADREA